jgi:hypothetical protein
MERNFNEGGVYSLQSYATQLNPKMDALEELIRVLKNNVAKQQIELESKTTLLKKVNSRSCVGRGNGAVQIKSYSH